MEFGIAVQGKLKEFYAANAKAVAKGGRRALTRTLGGIRTGLTRRIRSAGFKKPGLEKLVRSYVSRDGDSGIVKSKAVMPSVAGRRVQRVDLVKLFDQGTTVKAAHGKWLAVPTGAGPLATARGGGRQMTPDEMRAKGMKVRFIPSHPHPVIVLESGRGNGVVTHVLLRNVPLRSRYRISDITSRWVPRYPEILVQEIENAAASDPATNGRF